LIRALRVFLAVMLLLVFCADAKTENITNPRTLEQEKILINNVIKLEITNYVKNSDWTERRDYNKEAEDIGNIIQSFGWEKNNYIVLIVGDSIGLPDNLMVMLRGKVDRRKVPKYRLDWNLKEYKPKGEESTEEGPPECFPYGPFDFSCKKYKI